MDQITRDRIALLHPAIRAEVATLIDAANKATGNDITIRIVQGLRTFAEQNGLYALGRTVRNPDGATAKRPLGKIVTNAKGGQSYHNYGLAFDFAFLIKETNVISWDDRKDWDGDKIADWLEVVQIFVKAGYEWGGAWDSNLKDIPHIQKRFCNNWRELLKRVEAGSVIEEVINGKKYKYVTL